MKILLVEDHRDSAQVMAKILRKRGFEVEVAADCKAAADAFEAGHFDLVILDIRLPDGDGCDLLPSLAQLRPVKSIAVSAYPLFQNFNRIRAAGFDRYLHKPLAAQHIYEMIDDLFPNRISPTAEKTQPISPSSSSSSSKDKSVLALKQFAEEWSGSMGVEVAPAFDPALGSTSEPALGRSETASALRDVRAR